MKWGTPTAVKGWFTKDKFLEGRTLAEIELMLGFFCGRLRDGMEVVSLMKIPEMNEFELGKFTNQATQRLMLPEDLDIDMDKLKREARASFQTAGYERIVKVLPVRRHDVHINPDIPLMPNSTLPYWVATTPIPARCVGVLNSYPNGRYQPEY